MITRNNSKLICLFTALLWLNLFVLFLGLVTFDLSYIFIGFISSVSAYTVIHWCKSDNFLVKLRHRLHTIYINIG